MATLVSQHSYTGDIGLPASSKPFALAFDFVKGDGDSHQFNIAVQNGGEDVSLSGATCLFKIFRTADGETVSLSADVAGSVMSKAFTAECTAYAMPVYIMAVVTSGTIERTVWYASARVRAGASDVVVDPGSAVPSLGELLAQIAAMEAATAAATEATALIRYTFVKYSAINPTQNSDMKDTIDAWIGVYNGTSQTAPTAYTSYDWYEIKGSSESGVYVGEEEPEDPNKLVWIDPDSEVIGTMDATELSGAYEGVNLETVFETEIAAYSDVWAWIKARTQAENFAGLHVHDYIQVTCTNAGAYVLKFEIVGINTYKGSGGTEIASHIDWISKDCWPDTVTFNPANYNNGTGLDKFTAAASQTAFQLSYRGAGYPESLSSVTKDGTPTTDYTYSAVTGILTYTGAALSGGETIKAIWTTPVSVPFLASNVYAYMNSLKMGVPNEAALDPFLTEVDYSAGGIYYYLPAALKAVISNKRMYAATRYTAGSLLTSSNNYADVEVGPLWIPEEIEVCGSPMFATGAYDKWYARPYPAFLGGNRKKGAGNGGSRAIWWLFPLSSGAANFCSVTSVGRSTTYGASSSVNVPVCFRVAKT